MKVEESLRQLSIYPIPSSVIEEIMESRGLEKGVDNTDTIRKSKEFKLAQADVLQWLWYAPSNISENGISFSLSATEKNNLRARANKLYKDNGEDGITTIYGYKGSSFFERLR